MDTEMGTKHDVNSMVIAMGGAFVLALPYNYYQLQKMEKYVTNR